MNGAEKRSQEMTEPRLRLVELVTRHVGPVALELAPGECIGLSGPSGAGKTLLLRAIADLDVHEGDAFMDGVRCSELKGPQWRSHVALLPAESQWWFDTIGEHFSSVDTALLGQLGFSPEVMEWEVARCSTGERQRLALARLLANTPEVLLLDEPTASLDAENIARVEAVVTGYREHSKAAVIWCGHDAAQLQRIAGRRFRLAAGVLQEVAV